MNSENAPLKIKYRLDLTHYRWMWFDSFKKGFGNLLAFWGTLFILLSISAYYFRNSAQLFIFLLCAIALIILFLVWSYGSSYQSYMNLAKKNISKDSSLNMVEMIFRNKGDSFDLKCGKDFSRVSWDSVAKVDENSKGYVLQVGAGEFLIPQEAFDSAADHNFFRYLVSERKPHNFNFLE